MSTDCRQKGVIELKDSRLGVIESKFADIIWNNAPIKTAELIKHAESALGWKRTTTYTVLKRLTERGIFTVSDGTVYILRSKEELYSQRSFDVVEESFGGSLPAFIAAFTSKKHLTESEINEIQSIIEKMKRG